MKQCTKCKEVKELTEFNKSTAGKNGLCPKCKSCRKAYREANKQKIKAYNKSYSELYREANKDKIKRYKQAYHEANKEKISEKSKEYRQANKDKINAKRKLYREANKEKIKIYKKLHYEANKEKINANNKAYHEANKEKIRVYMRERMQTDNLFRLKCRLRTRTNVAFKRQGYSKQTKTQHMLGVDYEVAKAHIERQFKKGMSWSNHGEWHIDHIIPLASAKTEAELIKLCHYRNLQPLWAEENLSKNATIQESQTYLRI
jgi:hypothetical protein